MASVQSAPVNGARRLLEMSLLNKESNFIFKDITVVNDEKKGRCLQSDKNFSVGTVLFEETALVYGTFEDISCDEREELLLTRGFGGKFCDHVESYLDDLVGMDSIQSLDTAKCLLQLVALTLLQSEPPVDLIPDIVPKMALLSSLHGHNLDQCVNDIKQFRLSYPKAFPKKLTTQCIANLLGVLNVNQHELEDLGGSGLFVACAIMEHSCAPNCSFTTCGSKISVTAISPIATGSRLSIDYGNYYYSPTADRQEALNEAYGFCCDCSACTGPDRKRSFRCEHCPVQVKQSFIRPIGSLFSTSTGDNNNGDDDNGGGHSHDNHDTTDEIHNMGAMNINSKKINDSLSSSSSSSAAPVVAVLSWTSCRACGEESTASYQLHCLAEETRLRSSQTVASLALLQALVSSSVLHPSHYLVFAMAEELAMTLADAAKRPTNNYNNSKKKASSAASAGTSNSIASPYAQAVEAMQYVCEMMEGEEVLPPVHHEKVVFHDRLAQLAVAAGNIELAKLEFTKAFRMSELASGREAAATKALELLSKNTPTTVNALVLHYNKK